MEVHPVAALFPMMAEEELDELASDIQQRGLLQPIVLDDQDRVLDGRNRLAACHRLGIEPDFETYKGDDPDGYALAVNVQRRMLTTGARTLVVEQARRLSGQGVREAERGADLHRGRLSEAAVVLDYAPELADAVLAGQHPFHRAVTEARTRKAKREADAQRAAQEAAQLAELRDDWPELADRVADAADELTLADAWEALEQRRRDYRDELDRRAARVRQLCTGWVEVEALANGTTNADDLRELLSPSDHERLARILAIYTKGKA